MNFTGKHLSDSPTFNISIVEDDPIFLKVVAKHMDYIRQQYLTRGIKLNYTTYTSGSDFLEDGRSDNLVILDYFLDEPDGSILTGHEILNELKAEDPTSKVVFMSMISNEAEINSLKEDGAMMVIKKSPAALQFLSAVVSTEILHTVH